MARAGAPFWRGAVSFSWRADDAGRLAYCLTATWAKRQLVDVRKMPGSRRNPQFGPDILSTGLRRADTGYIHLPGLGGLRRRQPDSPNTGWKNASFQGYADYMLTPEFEQSLQQLLEQVRSQRAALMCAEAVPWRCHRWLIADALVARNVAVEHILSASRTLPHVLRPWAIVRGTRITYPPQAAAQQSS
jgi:uncharacterized protein (DUF488 family)